MQPFTRISYTNRATSTLANDGAEFCGTILLSLRGHSGTECTVSCIRLEFSVTFIHLRETGDFVDSRKERSL